MPNWRGKNRGSAGRGIYIKDLPFTKNRPLKLIVPDTISDIHWVLVRIAANRKKYPKPVLHPLGSKTIEFLSAVPFVEAGESVNILDDLIEGDWEAARSYGNSQVVVSARSPYDYAVSVRGPLLAGKSLEDIWSGQVVWNYAMMSYSYQQRVLVERLKPYSPYAALALTESGHLFEFERLGVDNISQLANLIKEKLNLTPIFLGSASDRACVDKLPCHKVNMTGLQGLENLALVKEAKLVIGWMSDLTVMATNFVSPTIIIWCQHLYPYPGSRTSWVNHRQLGRNYCPVEIDDFSAKDIVDTAATFLHIANAKHRLSLASKL